MSHLGREKKNSLKKCKPNSSTNCLEILWYQLYRDATFWFFVSKYYFFQAYYEKNKSLVGKSASVNRPLIYIISDLLSVNQISIHVISNLVSVNLSIYLMSTNQSTVFRRAHTMWQTRIHQTCRELLQFPTEIWRGSKQSLSGVPESACQSGIPSFCYWNSRVDRHHGEIFIFQQLWALGGKKLACDSPAESLLCGYGCLVLSVIQCVKINTTILKSLPLTTGY